MTSPRSASSFVGRTRELEVLQLALAEATEGRSRTVLIAGEAGVGKTRLVREFAARSVADARLLFGSCVEVAGAGLPYRPFLDALRPLSADLVPDGVEALVGARFRSLAPLIPELGDEGRSAREKPIAILFDLVVRLLAGLADRQPLVLTLEDLHWADRSTLDLVHYLVRNLHAEPVLLVATYRTDELGERDRLQAVLGELGRLRSVEIIPVRPFERAETVEHVTAVLGHSPTTALADAVFRRAEGNAFFTEELLAAGAEWPGAELPGTLRDLLLARFRDLSVTAQRTLSCASVIGRRSPHALLAAALELDEATVVAAVREATAAGLLVTEPGGDEYVFRHALVREALYSALLPGERRLLYASVAGALEGQPPSRGESAGDAGQRAHHWHAAGEPEPAFAASLEAAGAAERARALPEAQRHFERALALWDKAPDARARSDWDRLKLLDRTAELAQLTGDTVRAAELLREALAPTLNAWVAWCRSIALTRSRDPRPDAATSGACVSVRGALGSSRARGHRGGSRVPGRARWATRPFATPRRLALAGSSRDRATPHRVCRGAETSSQRRVRPHR